MLTDKASKVGVLGAGHQEQRGGHGRWDREELPPALARHPVTMSHITLTSWRSS